MFTDQCTLPDLTQRLQSVEEDYKYITEELGLPRRHAHMLGDRQWNYCRELRELVGLPAGPPVAPPGGLWAADGSAQICSPSASTQSSTEATTEAEMDDREEWFDFVQMPHRKLQIDCEMYKDVSASRALRPDVYRQRLYSYKHSVRMDKQPISVETVHDDDKYVCQEHDRWQVHVPVEHSVEDSDTSPPLPSI